MYVQTLLLYEIMETWGFYTKHLPLEAKCLLASLYDECFWKNVTQNCKCATLAHNDNEQFSVKS